MSRPTLSIMDADAPEVRRTRDKELTDASPIPVGSTALNALWYNGGAVASAAKLRQYNACNDDPKKTGIHITDAKGEEGAPVGGGGRSGEGAELHGSKPS